jgi:hypothetical protein
MHKRIWLLMLLAILLVAGTANAGITEISLGGGDVTDSVLIVASGSSATVSFTQTTGLCSGSANCISGYATFQPAGLQPQQGTFIMTYLTGANPTISSSGVMTGQVNFVFATTSGGAGTLQGVLTFSSLGNGNTQGPSFNGTFQTGSSTGTLGTPILYWGNGTTTNNAALTLNTAGNPPIIDPITGALNTTTGTSGSGQVYAPSPTPEPASILMLGSGLLALGGTIKRRYFR